MPAFPASDGTVLHYHVSGSGGPLVCLPGGPMQSADYLGDLGGLSAHRRLIKLDPRGTGLSQTPRDPATYRCDRLVADVESLREHLGLDRIDLLGHSAGTNLALLYAARHPSHVGRLVLVTPSTRAVGIEVTGQARLETARLRTGEPWFPAAYAALEAITAGNATEERWQAVAPFVHGRWDTEAQRYHAAMEADRNDEAAAVFAAEGAFDPEATRAALAALRVPVLVLAGRSTSTRSRPPRPRSPRCSPTPSSPSSRARATSRGSTTPTAS
ncbi:alpha/beta fold hydrolase [Nonomuraea antimicrobica]